MSELAKTLITSDQEAFIKISYKRGYNLGKYGDIKEYSLEISGGQSIVEEQLRNQRARLTKYVKEVESLIEDAHRANLEKHEAEKVLALQTAQEEGIKA